jgi:hypothetical protein
MEKVTKNYLLLSPNKQKINPFFAEETRSVYGLSQDLYKRSDYDRLALSLLSPLPNEQVPLLLYSLLLSFILWLNKPTLEESNNTMGRFCNFRING